MSSEAHKLPLFDQIFSGPRNGPPNSLSGADLRDAGIQAALDRAERIKADYVAGCLKAIASFAPGTLLTSENVREIAGDPPVEVNHSVLAGIMKRAASKEYGLIRITRETQPAKRASVHAKALQIWVRL